jgi:uncharacterized protein YndB with AHSA1/START domain
VTAVTHSNKATVTLPGDRSILIEREFDAPRHLVYEAITKPEHVARWWGAKRGDGVTTEADVRVGGTWRYVMTAKSNDMVVGFHGEYREIVPNERIVSTELFEMPGLDEDDASVNTVTLTERDGRTFMSVLCEYRLPEHRDAVIESGMEDGMQESYDALEAVAQSLS